MEVTKLMTTTKLFQDKNMLAFLQAKIIQSEHKPWLFVYISQTVAYAVRECFADILQPCGTIETNENDVGLNYDSRMLIALERFANSEDFSRCRFMSGHFKVFQVDSVDRLNEARLMTVLRDPVDRVIADFCAQNAEKQVRLTAERLLEFAKDPGNQNVYLQFLCPKGMWRPKECIEFIRNRMDFIGIAEDLILTVKMFYAIYGVRFRGQCDLNKRPAPPLARANLSADLVNTMATLNAVDYEIFRHFHDNLMVQKDQFFALTDHDKIFRSLDYWRSRLTVRNGLCIDRNFNLPQNHE
jgi:hypothetical protein